MEAATAARAGSLQMSPASASGKEWRSVSESHPSRSAGNEDSQRQKVGQVDERTIYEVQQGRQPLDTNLCAITVDASSEDVVLRHLEGLSRNIEDFQLLEIQLRAQMIANSEISEMKDDFDSQIKEHAESAIKLQEQLREKELALQDLERKVVEKDRETVSIKKDNEEAWAKDDLLREQKKELASFRQERDHSEAERLQHIQQIHELQEHVQNKESQLVDLQEQFRVAQENVLYKDEQLRDAQAWIARMQKMDALQAHSLQAELQERTEQCNQLWLVWQRQFAEMEGFHMHRLQQLELELADLKERNGSVSGDSHPSQSDMKDVSQLGSSKGNQHDANGSGRGTMLQKGHSGMISLQNEHMVGASLGSSTLHGLAAYIPPGQVNVLHPYIMHQQGHLQPVNSIISPEVGHHTSVPSVYPMQHWHDQQGASGESEVSKQGQVVNSQNTHNELISESRHHFQNSINGDAFQGGYVSQGIDHKSTVSSSTREVTEAIDGRYPITSASQLEATLPQISSYIRNSLALDTPKQNIETKLTEAIDGRYPSTSASQLEATLPQISSYIRNSLALDTPKQNIETKEYATAGSVNSTADEQGPETEKISMDAMLLPVISKNNEAIAGRDFVPEVGPDMISGGQSRVDTGTKSLDCSLLDERSLLACVVRTIPAGGRIRISSTLLNRLSKMLAPLHWHDYKKKYGRLDEFVASHPEFFLIEDDYIQLIEGAQRMIAAKAAVAKVVDVAAASTTYSSALPTVAVTPMAQARRLRNAPSIGSKQFHSTENGLVSANELLRVSGKHNCQNGVNFNISSGSSSIKILTKAEDSVGLNGVGTKASHFSNLVATGEYVDKFGIGDIKSNGASTGTLRSNLVPRPQDRL